MSNLFFYLSYPKKIVPLQIEKNSKGFSVFFKEIIKLEHRNYIFNLY